MEEKTMYTLAELFAYLPIPLAELARRSKINEVTLARIRDGKMARRDTANRLLNELSKVYERRLNYDNVTGLHVQGQEQEEETAA